MTKILWADDQVDVVKSFSRLLDPLNPFLEFCSSGEETLDAINRVHFDLLILDLKMPPGEWGGLWLLEQFNRKEIHLPVIIMSGEGSQAETIKALRLGADDYITKENVEDELLERVSQLIKKSIADNPSYQMIKDGESQNVEFKSTLRINLFTNRKDKKIEHSVLKTIAAFLNSEGGVLFIGVNDERELLGLGNDSFQSDDKMLLHLIHLMRDHIGVQFLDYVKLRIEKITNIKILKVTCRASQEPAYLNFDNKEEFYIRTGPATNSLQISEITAYNKKRF